MAFDAHAQISEMKFGHAIEREAFGGFAAGPLVPVEAVHQVAGDAVFLQHHGDGLGGVEGRVPLTAALGVGDERLLELIGEAEVIHHQSAGFVAKDAVHAGDGVHQAVALHLRLAEVGHALLPVGGCERAGDGIHLNALGKFFAQGSGHIVRRLDEPAEHNRVVAVLDQSLHHANELLQFLVFVALQIVRELGQLQQAAARASGFVVLLLHRLRAGGHVYGLGGVFK